MIKLNILNLSACGAFLRVAAVLFVGALSTFAAEGQKIDRRAVVERHNIELNRVDVKSPTQVGNGEFAMNLDITGLQTFGKLNTLSNWAWHSFPKPAEPLENFKGADFDYAGRKINLPVNNEQKELSAWLKENPHRLNLGALGFVIIKKDGTAAKLEDVKNARQKINLWTGIVESYFEIDGEKVFVKTACHPAFDMTAAEINSNLIKSGRLYLFINFPYGDGKYMAPEVGDWDKKSAHSSKAQTFANGVLITRKLDDTEYFTSLKWEEPAAFEADNSDPHKFYIKPEGGNIFKLTAEFSKTKPAQNPPASAQTFAASAEAWANFWQSGAAVDLSESTDARWMELERRIVLSQYLLRLNEAGTQPPQESGLVGNTWYGKYHFEMIWWHGLHYALWDRWPLFDGYLKIYRDFLPTSKERAAHQSFKGARWPKAIGGNLDREWPHIIHATLLWQQPHPIYFAEADYRLHPSKETLEKWHDVVFATADFMADFAIFAPATGAYNLGPPLFLVSENSDPKNTKNPAFELSYWLYGLKKAQEWRTRLGLPQDKKWQSVIDKLSPLPVQDGVYVTYQGIKDMWTKYAYEHPALIGTYGMLRGDGVDSAIFKRTLAKVGSTWNFNRTWGWDFPMLAMAALRSGDTEGALDYVLMDAPGFKFDEHGLATGGPFPYMPSNGALLAFIGMLCGGWDDFLNSDNVKSAVFDKNSSWKIKHEGFKPMQ